MTYDDLRDLAVTRLEHVTRDGPRKRESHAWRTGPNQCAGKSTFTSAATARQAATSIARRNGDSRMRAYRCHVCHRYHLAKVDRSS